MRYCLELQMVESFNCYGYKHRGLKLGSVVEVSSRVWTYEVGGGGAVTTCAEAFGELRRLLARPWVQRKTMEKTPILFRKLFLMRT